MFYLAAGVTEALLASAESAEVLDGLWDLEVVLTPCHG